MTSFNNPVSQFNSANIPDVTPVAVLVLSLVEKEWHILNASNSGIVPLPLPEPGQEFLQWSGRDKNEEARKLVEKVEQAALDGQSINGMIALGLKESVDFDYTITPNSGQNVILTLFRSLKTSNSRLEREFLFNWLIDQLPELALLELEDQMHCTYATGNHLELFKYPVAELPGKKLTEIIKDKKTLKGILQQISKPEKKLAFQLRKGSKYYEGYLENRSSADHRPLSLLLLKDVSVNKNIQQELETKVNDLARSNENLEQFAYVASHDLQEPLRKIRAFGDRLMLKYFEALDTTGQDYLNRMQNAAGRMQVLIEDLLKFSRLARQESNFEMTDLNQLFQDVLLDLETRIDETGAVVKIEEMPRMEVDTRQFRQLLQNLLSNAIKFHRKDIPPEVVVTGNYHADSPVINKKAYKKIKSHYRIEIRDNGIGFDEKYLDRIFNIFQRLHGRHEYQGTGIGLAICKKVVENHKGIIFAKSKPNEGSVFIIIIPNLIRYD